ncbi:MAG: phosphoribosylglycinamide formyltransferase [Bdellovibrionales bacterium RIFOXYD1_FULL_53_11]|nr:MAG: phosphoribosylglycinamide formyltransferase [Bdellovibrionales bacterium RIFOXYD1_FULL_53_11]
MGASGQTRVPVVIMASGRGSNFEYIMDAVACGRLEADVRAVVSDRQDAPVLEKARARGVRAMHVAPSGGGAMQEVRRAHEEAILREIAPLRPRFIVLAGYMRIIGRTLLDAFSSMRGYSRIVNIHPALLPAFPGRDGYVQAFNHGARIAGVTVHLVDEKVDHGPVCAQSAFDISGCGSADEVEAAGLKIEHELYPAALAWILKEQFEVEMREGRLCVRPN